MQAVDTVIIGGGIIGLSVAYELCRRGLRAWVLDRGAPAGSASFAAAGMLAPVSEAEGGIQGLLPFGLDSLRRYPAFVADLEDRTGLPVGFRREGSIWVARNRDEADALAHLAESLARLGLQALPLTAAEVLKYEPRLHRGVVGGLDCPSEMQVDPRALMRALRAAIEHLGGRVKTGCDVRFVDVEGNGFRIGGCDALGGNGLWAPSVVIAAGAWSGRELRLPMPRLRVRPVRGQLVRLHGEPLLERVIRTPECYLVPRSDGELLIGSTVEEQGFDASATAGAMHDLLRHAHAVLPAVYDLRFVEVSVGLRPALPDHLPAIGATEIPGLFLAVGHFRNGVLLAPATAHYLAEQLSGRAVPELSLFSPARLGLEAPQTASKGDG